MERRPLNRLSPDWHGGRRLAGTLSACAFCLVEEHIHKSLELTGQLNVPTQIYRQLRSFAKHFHHGRQEDAHELLRVAIEAMHQSCMKLIGRTKDGTCALLSVAAAGERRSPSPHRHCP